MLAATRIRRYAMATESTWDSEQQRQGVVHLIGAECSDFAATGLLLNFEATFGTRTCMLIVPFTCDIVVDGFK